MPTSRPAAMLSPLAQTRFAGSGGRPVRVYRVRAGVLSESLPDYIATLKVVRVMEEIRWLDSVSFWRSSQRLSSWGPPA